MKELTESRIADLVSGALERIAFVLVDPAEDGDCTEPEIGALIPYSGGGEESLVQICASPGFLTELASGMLGTDPDEVTAEVEGVQALRELANIVCGEIVWALGGEEERFDVGLPEDDPGDPIVGYDDEVTCLMASDDEGLKVHVFRRGDS